MLMLTTMLTLSQAGLNAASPAKPIFFSTEAGPNLTAMSQRPDLYGNTHRLLQLPLLLLPRSRPRPEQQQ